MDSVQRVVDQIVNLRIPELAAFLIALYWILGWTDRLFKMMVSNGLTNALKELKGSIDTLPDKVAAAVALKFLEHQVRQ